eukprot:SAG31_NODE_1987_length_6724_cov_18.235925_3_plen_247_part_00
MGTHRWAGYIKDYEGGTLMECVINKHIDYLDIPGMIQKQKQCLIDKIKQFSNSHVVHEVGFCKRGGAASGQDPPCSRAILFYLRILTRKFAVSMQGYEIFRSENGGPIKVEEIRGLLESGWKPSDSTGTMGSGDEQQQQQQLLQKLLRQVLKEIKGHSHSWPFAEPVNTDEVTEYLTVIKDPVDLQMIERRLKQPNLFYKTKEIFQADLKRMVDNCRTFNEPGSVWYNCADKLWEFIVSKLDSLPV